MKSIEQIIAELSVNIPEEIISQLPAKGSPKYIAHENVKAILNRVIPGWSFEIVDQGIHQVTTDKGNKVSKVWVRGRLTIQTDKEPVYRESFGNEDGGDPDKLYGDPWSNAEAQAFKRCAAWFGLGLYDLYGATIPRPTYTEEGIEYDVPENTEPVKTQEKEQHDFWTEAKVLPEKLRDGILRLAEGDLDRGLEILKLNDERIERAETLGIKIEPSWLQNLVALEATHEVEIQIIQSIAEFSDATKATLKTSFDYIVYALKSGVPIDHAKVLLFRNDGDFAAARKEIEAINTT